MRPALADVVAVLTGDRKLAEFWRAALKPYDPPARIFNRVEVSDRGVATFNVIEGLDPLRRVALQRWAHPSPADALAALVEAELLPEQWCDPERGPRWWCERCAGVGRVTLRSIDGSGDLGSYAVMPDARGDLRCDAFDVSGAPPCGAPPSHPALVAVASLGVDTLARAEAIVAETWRARVVWRVMGAEELVLRHEEMARNGDGQSAVYVTAHEHTRARNPKRFGGLPAWPEECPWMSLPPIVRVWPALRALAALGLHLVAVDDERVTLAVESV